MPAVPRFRAGSLSFPGFQVPTFAFWVAQAPVSLCGFRNSEFGNPKSKIIPDFQVNRHKGEEQTAWALLQEKSNKTTKMGFETGVILNIFGSLTINFSANLLKRAHLETAEELAQGVDDKLEGMDNMSNLDQQIKACDDKLDNAGSENGGTVNGPAEKVIGADTIENDELNKHIVKLENDHEVAPHRCKFPNRTWLAGVVLFIVGNVVNFVSFSFAAQSLLSALGSIQFVSNVVFARVLLHEVATKRMLFGTLLIILGNIVVVIYSSHESSGGFTVDELKDMYTASGYVGYISTLAVILVTAQAYYMYLMNKLEEEENGGPKLSLFSLQMIPTTYALVSGCIGTQSVTLAKSMSEVMRTSTEGDNQFSNYFTWVIFCSWVVCMVFWVTRMNIALRRFDGLFIVPVLQV